MELSEQAAKFDEAKLKRALADSHSGYQVLIDDVRSVAGDAPFNGLAKDDASVVEVCRTIPGKVCWMLNKSVGDPYQRREIARRVAARTPTLVDDAHDQARADAFRKTGFAAMDGLLSAAEVKEMADFLDARPRAEIHGPTAHNYISDVVAAPHTLRLATHPQILSIVRDHLGGAPTVMDMSAWWTAPSPAEDYGAHIFHRDRDDFRACKLFLYLTDVGTDDGPHVFALNTHDPEFVKAGLLQRGYGSDGALQLFAGDTRNVAHLISQLFPEQISEFVGPAGTCFLENTYGFHRGKNPTGKRRGLFQVMYAMTPYPARLQRLAEVKLEKLPPGCIDTPAARYAARLLFDGP